jgi:ABC-2 type transport system ATP-binding protein
MEFPMTNVITVKNLRKSYGSTVAVDDISFDVAQGEIFAILGPNGAGKTTAVETIVGLRRPDRGNISVLGIDPQQDAQGLRQHIGVQLQQAAVPQRLKVWEILDLFASFYPATVPRDRLIEQWGLGEKRNAYFGKLSGGQQQRLFIALALINDPRIVFFDELTTGLDPQARRATWELVQGVRAQGKTVVLVTHAMDEAELLADRVAIIDHGRIVALDTPQALIHRIQPEGQVRFTTSNGFDPALLQQVDGVSAVERNGARVTVRGAGPLLSRVAQALAEHHMEPADLRQERATLEDVFLAATGRGLRD